MRTSPTPPALLTQAWQAPHRCAPHHPERDFLSAPDRMPLAVLAQQFSSPLKRCLPCSTLAPPESLVGIFTALRAAERERVGRNPHPSAAIRDSQLVQTWRSRPASVLLMLLQV